MNDEIAKLVAQRVDAGFGDAHEVVRSGFIQSALIRRGEAHAQRAYNEYMNLLMQSAAGLIFGVKVSADGVEAVSFDDAYLERPEDKDAP